MLSYCSDENGISFTAAAPGFAVVGRFEVVVVLCIVVIVDVVR